MDPIVTPRRMAEIDAEAADRFDVLVSRAGAAVARSAVRLMGGVYGRRVVVVAGRGNNGNDGRVAAELLRRRGVSVVVVDAADADAALAAVHRPVDLVIDAAYGTGFRGSYAAPALPAGTRVLAVDIPSGIDGLTGAASGSPVVADFTVTFAALKPGLLFGEGRRCSGGIEVVDIGLDVGDPGCGLVGKDDLVRWLPPRPRDSHKWRSAVWVVGGSPGMTGAPTLAAAAAFAAGAGYVRVSCPGAGVFGAGPLEAVAVDLPVDGWEREVLSDGGRVGSLVVGPGLGRTEAVRRGVNAVVSSSPLPVVVDGDGLWAIAEQRGRLSDAPRVLTPHDGEYTQLCGHPPGADRIAAAAQLAAERRCVVLLKGPTTVIADPTGRTRVVTSGDQRLATAGTGDVLSGVIGAFLASGADPLDAAAAGADVHGRAGSRGARVGTTASSLPGYVSSVLSELAQSG